MSIKVSTIFPFFPPEYLGSIRPHHRLDILFLVNPLVWSQHIVVRYERTLLRRDFCPCLRTWLYRRELSTSLWNISTSLSPPKMVLVSTLSGWELQSSSSMNAGRTSIVSPTMRLFGVWLPERPRTTLFTSFSIFGCFKYKDWNILALGLSFCTSWQQCFRLFILTTYSLSDKVF